MGRAGRSPSRNKKRRIDSQKRQTATQEFHIPDKTKESAFSTIMKGVAIGVIAPLVAGGAVWVAKQVYDDHFQGPPIHISTEVFDSPCTSDWVIPRSVASAGFSNPLRIDEVTRWSDWAEAEGGAAASGTGVLVTVQGKDSRQVVINDIKVYVEERSAPLAGTILDAPCGDPGAYRWLQADLDKKPVKVTSRAGDPADYEGSDLSPKELTPIRFPYEVSDSDAETFYIEPVTEECTCTWWAEIMWSSAGRSGSVKTTDSATPFRVTSTRGSTRCTVTDNRCQ